MAWGCWLKGWAAWAVGGVSAGKEAGNRGRLWKAGRENRGNEREEGCLLAFLLVVDGRTFLLVLTGRILLFAFEIFRGAFVTGEIPSNSSRPGTAKGVSTRL